MKELLSGNEAFARGAWEAGCRVAAAYPGTPSTEILENLSRWRADLYCEWSVNEKVAFETAVGASLSGARALVTMKHVGLNVAADPLMTAAYLGAVGGLVVVVADDPGMHSSQNEQDTRHYARFAKVPLLEPADSQEALDFIKLGFALSEQFGTPVLVRSETRVSHSKSPVATGARKASDRPVAFEKNPPRFVAIPAFARPMRQRLEERLQQLRAAAEKTAINRIEWRDRELGIITHGVSYQYVREVFPEASVLKLGWSWPFPDPLIRTFAAGVRRLLVVEELDDFIEEHVKALGLSCEGKNMVPNIGELSPEALLAVKARYEGGTFRPAAPVAQAADLPTRPPVLCPGCPHRGVFHALGQRDVVVSGDIGCYSLGVLPPLSRLDTILCMGAGFTVAHGMERAGEPRKVVGILGDSTFFHSGITGALNIAYNRGAAVLIALDNRITAMTGHQENPGSGRTLMDTAAPVASIEELARACGIRQVRTVNPYEIDATLKVLDEALAATEVTLIVSKAACPLHARERIGPARRIDPDTCIRCGQCLQLGCPAIEATDGAPHINTLLCTGCSLCKQVCPCDAIA